MDATRKRFEKWAYFERFARGQTFEEVATNEKWLLLLESMAQKPDASYLDQFKGDINITLGDENVRSEMVPR